jgi:hypothetical protein
MRKSRPAEYNAAGKAKYLAKLKKEDEAYEEHMTHILKREGKNVDGTLWAAEERPRQSGARKLKQVDKDTTIEDEAPDSKVQKIEGRRFEARRGHRHFLVAGSVQETVQPGSQAERGNASHPGWPNVVWRCEARGRWHSRRLR